MVRRRIRKTARLAPLLAVGGLDPSGHAGLLADARVFEAFGLTYRVAVTAVTAQSETEFLSWKPVSISLFEDQLKAAGSNILGVKVGMLGTPRHLEVLIDWIQRHRPRFVVWDPVLCSSTGAQLFRGGASEPGLARLLKLSDVFTPNLPEAEWLLRSRIKDAQDIANATETLLQQGAKKGRIVVLKGGHSTDRKYSTDWVRSASALTPLKAPRQPGSRRGSGCIFATALLSCLSLGHSSLQAATLAKSFVRKKLFES